MAIQIHNDDCLNVLPTLPSQSINCCVTSPPYYGLRDYGIEGQIGLEQTPKEYVDKMVNVFREVWRVLRDDGTVWLNLGDSYAGGGRECDTPKQKTNKGTQNMPTSKVPKGCKTKDLIGIPWRVAFALQDDGWYLRQDIIWQKPNPMPESVQDRCTKAHEYVFLLTKSTNYYYDQEAIKEKVSGTANPRRSYKTPDGWDTSIGCGSHGNYHKSGREKGYTGYTPKSYNGSFPGRQNGPGQNRRSNRPRGVTLKSAPENSKIKANDSFQSAVCDLVEYRNKRSVWTVTSEPYHGAHFSVFPASLITPCVLAGCPQNGWVLDPFAGTGTVGEVAEQYGRNAVVIEMNAEYIPQIKQRTSQPGLFCQPDM